MVLFRMSRTRPRPPSEYGFMFCGSWISVMPGPKPETISVSLRSTSRIAAGAAANEAGFIAAAISIALALTAAGSERHRIVRGRLENRCGAIVVYVSSQQRDQHRQTGLDQSPPK